MSWKPSGFPQKSNVELGYGQGVAPQRESKTDVKHQLHSKIGDLGHMSSCSALILGTALTTPCAISTEKGLENKPSMDKQNCVNGTIHNS